MEKIIEWMNENPSGNFSRMWTAISADKFNGTVSRQNIKKVWDKAIKQLSRKVQTDRKFQKFMQDVSIGMKAASVTVETSKLKSSDDGWRGLVKLGFVLEGASATDRDPRQVLANSPKTLKSLLEVTAQDIEFAVNASHWKLAHAQVTELVINENLANTWTASRVGSGDRFEVLVGVAGSWE